MHYFKKEHNLVLILFLLSALQFGLFVILKDVEHGVLVLGVFFLLSVFILSLLSKNIRKMEGSLELLKVSLETNFVEGPKSCTKENLVDLIVGVLRVISLFTKKEEFSVTSRKDLVNNLFNLVQNIFSPLAIKISLSEDASGLSIQNFMVGSPKRLDEEIPAIDSHLFVVGASMDVGNLKLGDIYVEQSEPWDEDIREYVQSLLELVAKYGALAYVDVQLVEDIKRLRVLGNDSEAQKTGFVAGLSHEIRGPLGVILNAVELVLDGLCGDVTESQIQTLGMVKGSTKHLLDLVNDVLDFAKVESGVIEVKPRVISASDTLSDLVSVVRSQALKKQQKLVLEHVDERLAIYADKKHLRQVIINLLTNAIKYTPEGGDIRISVEVSSSKLEGIDEAIRIKVVDTGVGIAEEEKAKVFQAFQRVNDAYSLRQEGTGLGMPLSKRLVEANRGVIDFSSTVGEGSEFWFDLPLSRMEPVRTEEHEGVPLILGNNEEILLFEPDGEQQGLYSMSLEQRGFKVEVVSNINELVKCLSRNKFDVIIADSDCEEGGGEDLIRSIRNMPKGGSVPLIVLSGKAFNFDIEHFLRLGVDRCISRPFTLSELSSSVRRLLDEVGKLSEVS